MAEARNHSHMNFSEIIGLSSPIFERNCVSKSSKEIWRLYAFSNPHMCCLWFGFVDNIGAICFWLISFHIPTRDPCLSVGILDTQIDDEPSITSISLIIFDFYEPSSWSADYLWDGTSNWICRISHILQYETPVDFAILYVLILNRCPNSNVLHCGCCRLDEEA